LTQFTLKHSGGNLTLHFDTMMDGADWGTVVPSFLPSLPWRYPLQILTIDSA
jgi:hypothetical protein